MEHLQRFQGDLKALDKLAGVFQVSRQAMGIGVVYLFGSARGSLSVHFSEKGWQSGTGAG